MEEAQAFERVLAESPDSTNRQRGGSMRRLLALLAASLLFVFVPGSATAITNGQPDTENRYPSVGLLAFYDSDGVYMHRCTGTLLSPTVVLTAAHCTDGTATAYAYFSVDVPDDFRENPTGNLGTTYTHPDFGTNLHNDVGVVLLDDPVNLSEYPVLAPEGFLTELKEAHEIQDDTFVAVGYGLLNGSPPPNLLPNENRWFGVSPYRGLKKKRCSSESTGTGTAGIFGGFRFSIGERSISRSSRLASQAKNCRSDANRARALAGRSRSSWSARNASMCSDVMFTTSSGIPFAEQKSWSLRTASV